MGEFEDLETLVENGEEFVETVQATAVDPAHPFWRIGKNDVAPILRVMKDISSRNADQVSKSVCLSKEGARFVMSATNKDVLLQAALPLKNEQGLLQDTVILSLKQLDDISRFSSDVVLYKEGEEYKASFMGGQQPMTQYSFSKELYSGKDGAKGDAVQIECVEATAQVSLFANLMALASVAEDKKIVVKGGFAYGSFISVLSRVQTNMPDITLRNSDTRDLVGLLNYYKEPLKVSKTEERVFFRSKSMSYSSLAASSDLSKDLMDKFKSKVKGVPVDTTHLFNIFAYLALTNGDASSAHMEVTDVGLEISCRNKVGVVSKFNVDMDTTMVLSADLQISTAKRVFSILRAFPMVCMSKGEGFIRFEAEGVSILQSIRNKE